MYSNVILILHSVIKEVAVTETTKHAYTHTESLLYGHSTAYFPKSEGMYQLHTHDVCELLLLKSGKASYTVEGRNYPLKKNSLVITRPSCIHTIRIESDEPYDRYNLLFDPQRLLPDLYNAIPQNLDVLHLDSNHAIVGLFQKMDLYFKQFQGKEQERLLTLLAEEIFFNIRLEASHAPEQNAVSSNPLIQQAIAYIEAHITTLTDIEEICSALFITKSHLHHLFVRHMQITPKKYIISKRLALAQRALRSGAKPTEIYLKFGFNNYATFYRDYKRYYGCSPSDELSVPELREIPL